VSRHNNKTTKKQGNPLMKVLVFIFIFIPAGFLGYVWFFFEPKAEDVAVEAGNNAIVQIQKNEPSENNVAVGDDAEEEEKPVSQENAHDSEQKQIEKQAAKEAAVAEEAQKIAAQKAKEQEAKMKATEEKKKVEEQAKVKPKTHTVLSTDNLYQIAIKYYGNGSPANIAKIKQANNLSSDSISLGQQLIIP